MDLTEKTIGTGWSSARGAKKRVRPGLTVKRAKKAVAQRTTSKTNVQPKAIVERSSIVAPTILLTTPSRAQKYGDMARVVLWVALAIGAVAFGVLLQAK